MFKITARVRHIAENSK